MLLVTACQPEPPRVLTAGDDLHSLVLYKNQRFSIVTNGLEEFGGTFSVQADTLWLNYDAEEKTYAGQSVNQGLVRKLVFQPEHHRLRGAPDGSNTYFCASADSSELAALFP